MSETEIFIGNKGVMPYITALIMILDKNSGKATIRARGRAISKAVDVVEIARNRFDKRIKIEEIKISTEQIIDEKRGNPLNLSCIDTKIIRG